MTDEQTEKDRELGIVKSHCAMLQEHFDSVQVFVTRYDSSAGTVNVAWGSGNYFSRYGQVVQWIEKENAIETERATEDEQ